MGVVFPKLRIPHGKAGDRGLGGGSRQVRTRLQAPGKWVIGGRMRSSMGAAWKGLGVPAVGFRSHPQGETRAFQR